MAYIPWKTRDRLLEELNNTGMQTLYDTIELPLVYTLSDMEKEGVHVDAEELKRYGGELAAQIAVLEKEIYEGAGETFNINSPKQLGHILFEKLEMPYGKKTKTGYSTAADVLEKLAVEYPLVSKILEYRQLAKLKSTYADGLANFIEEDGRIHTNFQQTVTARKCQRVRYHRQSRCSGFCRSSKTESCKTLKRRGCSQSHPWRCWCDQRIRRYVSICIQCHHYRI